MSKNKTDLLDEQNAALYVELLMDENTTDSTKFKILEKLTETDKDDEFFDAMFKHLLSYGECPNCHFAHHWLIPVDVLAQMGWVLHQKDDRIKASTTEEDCAEFQEACAKKCISMS
jgi:hypothetical protein